MEVNFYHLTRTSIEKTLPRLLEKVLDAQQRALVLTESSTQTNLLNEILWTYSTNAFLPHGTILEGYANEQPIWLTEKLENLNSANILVQLSHDPITDFNGLKKCLYLFDSNQPNVLEKARKTWSNYKNAGYFIRYFQQENDGTWIEQKKAG